jgi:starvation-inducible outer membrane lipoprotein
VIAVRRPIPILALAAAVALVLAGCSLPPSLGSGHSVACGRIEEIDCNDLLEIGLDAIAGERDEEPAGIAVDDLCPPSARCQPSSLGGITAAVVVRWADGSVEWATIPLPPDWPASEPGAAVVQQGAPPAHVLALVRR